MYVGVTPHALGLSDEGVLTDLMKSEGQFAPQSPKLVGQLRGTWANLGWLSGEWWSASLVFGDLTAGGAEPAKVNFVHFEVGLQHGAGGCPGDKVSSPEKSRIPKTCPCEISPQYTLSGAAKKGKTIEAIGISEYTQSIFICVHQSIYQSIICIYNVFM